MSSTGRLVIRSILPPLAAAFSTSSAREAQLEGRKQPVLSSAVLNEHQHPHHASERLIFIGTGSSTGCPRPLCPMVFQEKASSHPRLLELQKQIAPICQVSNLAIQGDPKHNKNYRNNPSLVIGFIDDHGAPRHIIIDTGKTFREAALRWFPERGVTSLDAVILTHEHADAAFGLDDVRGFQSTKGGFAGSGSFQQTPMPVYLSPHCLTEVAGRFPWLFPNHQPRQNVQGPSESPIPIDQPQKPKVKRHVASLEVHVMEPFQAFEIYGLRIVPLPVIHGEDLISYGYAFTVGRKNILYLSDISRMLPETLDFIRTKLPPTDVLIIDSLHPDPGLPRS